jgi:hypothetical protein
MTELGLVFKKENRAGVHLFGDPFFKELQVGIHAALREYDVAKQVPIVRGPIVAFNNRLRLVRRRVCKLRLLRVFTGRSPGVNENRIKLFASRIPRR